MLLKAGLLLLLGTVLQVPAEHVKPDFIENVIERELAANAGSRIVSGWEAVPGQHPHHAALRMVDSTGGVSACGGSIVHRGWVMTAAHCTAGFCEGEKESMQHILCGCDALARRRLSHLGVAYPAPDDYVQLQAGAIVAYLRELFDRRNTLVVRAGVVSLTTPEYIFETTEWYNHPTYNDMLPGLVQPNDISIVKLQRPVTYSRLLSAIRIHPASDASRNYAGERLYASGHGRTWSNGATTEVLNWVYLTGVSNADCFRTFGSIITDTTICARFFNVTSQSTCQGDSGGPLVHVGSDGVPYLIGVTSFVAGGDFGCHSGFPAGFVRPAPFLPWFKEITGIDFENLVEEPEEEDKPEEETPEPDTPEEENPDGEDNESDSEEDEDKEVSELLKRLEVSVKVKVKFNKYKIKKEIETDKEF